MNYNEESVRNLAEIIESRRTVKPYSFNGEEVDKTIIEKILESANWAPNHGRTEPWRFKVYSGDGRRKLLELWKELYKNTTPMKDTKAEKIEKMEVNCSRSSHIIVIMMKRQENERIPKVEEIEAVACAVQNLALTATAYGVCGYWSSGGIIYKKETIEAFGLSEKDLVLGFYYLGLSDDEIPEGKRITSIKEKVEWIDS